MKKQMLPASLMLLLTAAYHGAPSQEAPTPARRIAIRWGVISNFHPDENASCELFLSNQDTLPLAAHGWTLFFNSSREIVLQSLPASVHLTHINGDFYKLEPAAAFQTVLPGNEIRIPFTAKEPIINATAGPDGFYFVFANATGHDSPPQALASVTVEPFLTAEQASRGTMDHIPLQTPAQRFAENQALTMLPADAVGKIVPAPVHLQLRSGQLNLTANTEIHYAHSLNRLKNEASYLAESLSPQLGSRIRIVESRARSPHTIALSLGEVNVNGHLKQSGDEAYSLSIDPAEGISITGTDDAGVFYGIQSLRELIPPEAYGHPLLAISLPAVLVQDAPRFPYRGLHLDVARNFQSKQAVMKLLDRMALYKLNKLQFHLTDDEGWRLEIPGLPELTAVGSRRGHTLNDLDFLVPSFGSGPFPDPAVSHGTGHYTRADFIEILRYATQRHIEIIPELETMGHARASVQAMKARYLRLSAQGNEKAATEYMLHDPQDRSVYVSVQGWNDNVVNVCQPSALAFFEKVVSEISSMYREAGATLTAIHVGGDELPAGVWTASPACKALIASGAARVKNPADLYIYFLSQLNHMLSEHHLITSGWAEIGLHRVILNGKTLKEPNPEFAKKHFRVFPWDSTWGDGNEGDAYKLANSGFDLVMAHASNFYFDLPYDKDPEEPGNYWAGFVGTRQPYEFAPFDLYSGARSDVMGNPIDPQTAFKDSPRLTEAGKSHILGLQGELWSEVTKGQPRMEYQLFPKLLSLSERAWAKQQPWETIPQLDQRDAQLAAGWNEFANRLGQRELPRLSYLDGGVSYRLPPPGAVVEGGVLKANTAFPGLTIRYTTDGSEPDIHSNVYSDPVQVHGTIKLEAFSAAGKHSRPAVVSAP